MERSYTDMVREFHEYVGAPTPSKPHIPYDRVELRYALVDEEIQELCDALYSVEPISLIEVADAIADSIYVLCGMAIEFGIPLDEVFAEVHRSNMTKTPGLEREDGKVMKGPNFEPPKIREILYGK
jgi:predicted HAD superfamily Cof-like phosphohydrolase